MRGNTVMDQDSLRDIQYRQEQALAQLERQLERGGLFTHTIASRNADEIHEAESFLYGVIDLLIEKGIVTRDEVRHSAGRVRQEMEERGLTTGPGIALRIERDVEKKNEFVPVNCPERLPICKAACCRLNFAFTSEEVESGHLKWDLGEPYYIRREATGYCYHIAVNTLNCSAYDHRPGVCRRYSCAHDDRIWKNFEKMELNEEWIQRNLSESRPRLAQALMFRQADIPSGTREEG